MFISVRVLAFTRLGQVARKLTLRMYTDGILYWFHFQERKVVYK